jgi:molecular chaperone DnaJ
MTLSYQYRIKQKRIKSEMSKNLYEILGIDRNATQDDIKKAYKKKARETHPDVGGSEEEFKLVNEAYSILSDPQKKNQYDNPRQQHFQQEFDMSDFFSQFGFGDFGGFGGFRSQQANQYHEDLDIYLSVDVPLTSIYQDKKVTVNFVRNVPCSSCDGSGVEESVDSAECLHCDGVGKTRRNGALFECGYCHGNGKIHTAECSTCNGAKVKPKNESISIDNIFVMTDEPQTISYRNYGHFSKYYRGRKGTLHLTLVPEINPKYVRHGMNLIYELELDYRTVINGGDIEYKHLDDKVYKIAIPEKSNKSSKFKLGGKGLLYRDKVTRADLILEVSIIIDYTIPEETKKKKKKGKK